MTAIGRQSWASLTQRTAPERRPTGLDAVAARLLAPRPPKIDLRRAGRILSLAREYSELDGDRWASHLASLRVAWRAGDKAHGAHALVDQSLATMCAAVELVTGLTPHPNQVASAVAMLRGAIVELATGEGKTLVAVLVAGVRGWDGWGCHVVTANDYLAKRDAQWASPIYERVGLSCGAVIGESTRDQRVAAYACGVTYATGRELAADFLRDRLALGRSVSVGGELARRVAGTASKTTAMRALRYAVVDEADFVMIDDAATPLILSNRVPGEFDRRSLEAARAVALRLEPQTHYRVDSAHRTVDLTAEARRTLDREPALQGLLPRQRDDLVTNALLVEHLYHLGGEYVVSDGKAVIVDASTGRLMPDRSWQGGIHEAVEIKEGIELSGTMQTSASISFQRFFRLYASLCGMTGTAREARREFHSIYGVPVVRCPTHRPIIRRVERMRILPDRPSRDQGLIEVVSGYHDAGRPILIGCRSVKASIAMAEQLQSTGLSATLLNAERHREEAQIIADAGRAGQITIVTAMAGRGTDIKLDEEARAAGGLVVVSTAMGVSRRVDRQLWGRSGRQGDPGLVVRLYAKEDPEGLIGAPIWAKILLRLTSGARLLKIAQRRRETTARRARARLMKSDDWLDDLLGYAGVR